MSKFTREELVRIEKMIEREADGLKTKGPCSCQYQYRAHLEPMAPKRYVLVKQCEPCAKAEGRDR